MQIKTSVRYIYISIQMEKKTLNKPSEEIGTLICFCRNAKDMTTLETSVAIFI